MAFQFSKDDVARSITVTEKVWVPCQIVKVAEEPNKKGDAVNQVVDMKVLQGDYEGMMLRAWFSEKAPSAAFPFLSAMGVEISKGGGTVNFESFQNRNVLVQVEPGEYNGKPSNNIVGYRPIED